jgi:heme-degrading monooxygenase HmoA
VHARTAHFTADPARLDDGVARLRSDVLPELHRVEGFIGLSALVDRASGRCIATSAWRDEQVRAASAAITAQLRALLADALGGAAGRPVPDVAEWEFAGVHRRRRTPVGACTRVVWGHVEPGRVDELRDAHRSRLLPRLEEVPGFVSVTLLVDAGRGRMAAATTYDDRTAMERADDEVTAVREELTRSTGLRVTETGQFELALAHLRVPELV